MLKISIGLLYLLLGAAPAVSYAGYEFGQDRVKAIVVGSLVDEQPQKAKVATKIIGNMYRTDTAVLDVVAERLTQGVSLETEKNYIDLLSWYAKTLGNSKNSRYRDVLLSAKKSYTNEKITKYIDLALNQLSATSTEQYVSRTLNVLEIQQSATRLIGEYVVPSKLTHYGTIEGEGFEGVVRALGAPKTMDVLITRVGRWGKQETLTWHYPGLGVLVFVPEENGDYILGGLLEESFNTQESYQGKQISIAQFIATLRGEEFRLLLKMNGGKIKTDLQLSKALCKRIEVLPFPADKLEKKALSLAVKLIATSLYSEKWACLESIAKLGEELGYPRIAQKYLSQKMRSSVTKEVKESNEDSDLDTLESELD